jgi:hypothetical protein
MNNVNLKFTAAKKGERVFVAIVMYFKIHIKAVPWLKRLVAGLFLEAWARAHVDLWWTTWHWDSFCLTSRLSHGTAWGLRYKHSSQLNLVHTTTTQFPLVHFNIILPSKSGSLKWLLLFRFSDNSCACLPYRIPPCYLPRPSHYLLFGCTNTGQ